VLELAEEALDQIALAIDTPVDGAMHDTLAGGRDVGFGPARPDQLEHSVRIVAAVGDDVLASDPGQQVWGRTQIVSLSGSQN
jgi:hypothetical protein